MTVAALAAGGPLAAGNREAYERLIGEIERGAALHYGSDSESGDRDLDLLLGDQSYATGLGRLADLGDLDAIAQLADVISLVSQAQAAGDQELVAAVWEAGAIAVGWGASEALEEAKRLARTGTARAAESLRRAGLECRRGRGSGEQRRFPD